VENIGLETAGVKVEKSHVVINQWGETDVAGVWAIGDLVGPPWLAHKGMHEGVIVAERIAGVKGVHPLDVSKVPGCTYCSPQIASVGLTEARAKAGGRKIKVGRFPFIANGKAIAMGDAEGLIKAVFDAETGELLGAHMIGEGVTELIHGYAMARTLEATEADLAATIFPHPTLSEMLHEAVLDADKRALHI
jgi:dihydrolipoamide dehydrogenase